MTIDTLSSDFNTYLNVFTGSILTNLSCVALSDDVPNVAQSQIGFQARAGQEYQIMVDGMNSASDGNIILKLSLQPNFEPGAVAGADAFANRGRLAGLNAPGVAL